MTTEKIFIRCSISVSIYYFVYVNRDDVYRIKSFKRICRYKVLEIAVSVRFMYKLYSNLTKTRKNKTNYGYARL